MPWASGPISGLSSASPTLASTVPVPAAPQLRALFLDPLDAVDDQCGQERVDVLEVQMQEALGDACLGRHRAARQCPCPVAQEHPLGRGEQPLACVMHSHAGRHLGRHNGIMGRCPLSNRMRLEASRRASVRTPRGYDRARPKAPACADRADRRARTGKPVPRRRLRHRHRHPSLPRGRLRRARPRCRSPHAGRRRDRPLRGLGTGREHLRRGHRRAGVALDRPGRGRREGVRRAHAGRHPRAVLERALP